MAHNHEYITYETNELKELFDAQILTGTIVSVNTGNDTASVDISDYQQVDNVPIFYHCEGESTVEGGSSAFSEGDSVYVFNKEGASSPGASDLQIVGFVDGLKPCGFFWFKLTRADGTLVDEALFSYFKVYNSSGASVSTTQTYDAETEYWTITANPPFIRDPNGYWVEYKCIDGIETQYPDKYKAADKKKVADLIQPGTYEGTIHYFKTEDVSSSVPRYNNPNWCPSWPPEVSEDYFFWVPANLLAMKPGLNFIQKSLNVKSSVPYKITRRIRTAAISGYTKPDAWFAGEAMTLIPSIYPDNCNEPGDAWCRRDIIWEDGVVQIQFTGGSLDVTIGYGTTGTSSVADINNSPSIAGITDDIEVTDLTPGSRTWQCTDGIYLGEASGVLFAAMYDKRIPDISATWDI